MSLDIVTKKNLWKYYIKLSDFKAQCKFCENKYTYIEISNFITHIAKIHKNISKYEEERKRIKWPWMYFKYSNELYSQCVICDANVLSTSESIKNHLSLHSEEQWKKIPRSWSRKYCTQRSDFAVECNICHKNISIFIAKDIKSHTKKIHPNELINMQENDIIGSSKRVSLFETATMPISVNILNKENIWKYYTKLLDFKAQCRYCTNKYCYVTNTNFSKHVAKYHRTIWKYEKKRKLIRPWMYFKYSNKLYSQCVICNTDVLSTSKSVENHLSLHSEQQQKNYIYQNWSQKYWAKRTDFGVECNICHDNVILGCNAYVYFHTKIKHLNKLKNTQETHEAVGSSERISLLETDTMLMSPKDFNLEDLSRS